MRARNDIGGEEVLHAVEPEAVAPAVVEGETEEGGGRHASLGYGDRHADDHAGRAQQHWKRRDLTLEANL